MLNKLKNTMWACPFNGTENRTKSVFLIMGCLLWKIIIVKTHWWFQNKWKIHFIASLKWMRNSLELFQLSPGPYSVWCEAGHQVHTYIWIARTASHPPVPDVDIRIFDFRFSANSLTDSSFWMCYIRPLRSLKMD